MLSALLPGSYLLPCATRTGQVGTQQEESDATYGSGRELSPDTKSANTLILDVQPLELCETNSNWLSFPVCGILQWQSQATKTPNTLKNVTIFRVWLL